MNLKDIIEIYLDYIDDEGFVRRYDYDNKKYYNTGICLKGAKGNPGNPGRPGKDGLTPRINQDNGHWMIGDVDTGVTAEGSGSILLKTVNGESLLGTGDIATKAYHTFDNSWNTSSIKNLCDSMIADSNVKAGMSYYGKFTGSGLPSPLGQAEITIEVIADDLSNGKSLFLTVYSADTAPYKWEAQYVKINGNYPSTVTWRAYLQLITNSNKLSSSLVSGLPTNVSQLNNDVPYVTDALMKVEVGDANGHDYVEIAGIKWATMNVGASSVTDYGLYFQWGDIQGYTAEQVGTDKNFEESDNKYYSNYNYTKYNATDGLVTLQSSDDAVTAAWGGGWRMPTVSELIALGEAVNTAWTQVNGVSGVTCTDKTDETKTLFFPAGGSASYGSMSGVGYDGLYWSSLLDAELDGSFAFYSHLIGGWKHIRDRSNGLLVRGVLGTTLVPKYVTKLELTALETDMNNKISAAYHHAGTKTVSQLTASLLVAEHEGEVYNITDSGTTTSNFLEGQGLPIREGCNVGIARIVNGNNISYKFDLLSGLVNTSNFVLKSDTVGLIKNDGTIDTNVYLTSHLDISNLVTSTSIRNIVVLTLNQYDTLVSNNLIDANTEYNIV